MIVKPFRGLAPRPTYAGRVVSVPYDVVSRSEAAALADGNPYSLLRVDRAEIELPEDADPYAPQVYERARHNLASFQDERVLLREDAPVYYLYRLTMGNHTQLGIAATVRAVDYENGLVKKHEKTRPEKEDDRTRLIDAINAQTGPILLCYRGQPVLDDLLKNLAQLPPTYDTTAEDGVRHTVWRISDTAAVERAFESVPAVYIADGHHRAASGARVAALRRKRDGVTPGSPVPSEQILAVLFPAEQLQVLAYNRVVRDLNGLTPNAFREKVAALFHLLPEAPDTPAGPRHLSMYLEGCWRQLSWPEDPGAGPVDRLDVSVLQDRLLAPVLGIDNPRTSPRIEFVGGIRGTAELVRKVDSGAAAVAFSMYPTTAAQVMDIADAGEIMPPKSTWFEPKLRSGFFIHVLD